MNWINIPYIFILMFMITIIRDLERRLLVSKTLKWVMEGLSSAFDRSCFQRIKSIASVGHAAMRMLDWHPNSSIGSRRNHRLGPWVPSVPCPRAAPPDGSGASLFQCHLMRENCHWRDNGKISIFRQETVMPHDPPGICWVQNLWSKTCWELG